MQEFYTSRGTREDLVQEVRLSTILEKGYAFPRIFPIITQRERSGTFSHAVRGMTTAQGTVGRVNGTDLAATEIKSAEALWSVARIEGRTRIFESEVKGLGGIENVDRMGAEDAGRKAMNSAEVISYGLVFSAARKTAATLLPDHSVVKTLQQTARKVRPYGKPYLTMSVTAWLTLCDIPEIRLRLFGASGATGDLGFMTHRDPKVMQLVSTLLMFEGVILWDDEIVGAVSDGYAAVIGLRDEVIVGGDSAAMAAKGRAAYGMTFLYLPEGAADDYPFTLQSHDDRNVKANYYDAEGFQKQIEFNADAVKVCKFADAYTEFAQPATPPAPVVP